MLLSDYEQQRCRAKYALLSQLIIFTFVKYNLKQSKYNKIILYKLYVKSIT